MQTQLTCTLGEASVHLNVLAELTVVAFDPMLQWLHSACDKVVNVMSLSMVSISLNVVELMYLVHSIAVAEIDLQMEMKILKIFSIWSSTNMKRTILHFTSWERLTLRRPRQSCDNRWLRSTTWGVQLWWCSYGKSLFLN